jgi:hypothetical protein
VSGVAKAVAVGSVSPLINADSAAANDGSFAAPNAGADAEAVTDDGSFGSTT